MQAIAFPEVVSAEIVRETLINTAWQLLTNRQLTLDTFLEMIDLNAATHGGATLFRVAISRAITEESLTLARALTERGLRQYPDNDALRHYQTVLAPPQLIGRTPSTHNYSSTMRWLSAHSHDYVGQWIAVQDGVLLGTGTTRRLLVEQLGARAEQHDVLITRVPAT